MSSGPLAATEQPDYAAFNPNPGGFGLSGYGQGPYGTSLTFPVTVTEAGDSAAFTGSSAAAAVIAANEAGDASNVQGSTSSAATLAASEAPDTAVVAGSIGTSAVLAATEATDTAAGSGSSAADAVLSATEPGDSVFFDIDIRFVGAVLAVEAPDSAAFAGSSLADLFIAATEAQDGPDIDGFLEPYLHRVDRADRPNLTPGSRPSAGALVPVIRPPRQQDFTILERWR